MYDEIVQSISFTADELDIIKELLIYRLDQCISAGEEIIIKELLQKIEH